MAYAFHRRLWVKRDNSARPKYLPTEINKLVLKSLIAERLRKPTIVSKIYFTKLFHKYTKKTAISYYRTYCHKTGTGKSVFKYFKYGRHECKRLASNGILIGMRKSSF